jgi:hypothetical protein
MVIIGRTVHHLACTVVKTDLKVVSKQSGVESKWIAHIFVGAVTQSYGSCFANAYPAF